jgi:hypothetical protein
VVVTTVSHIYASNTDEIRTKYEVLNHSIQNEIVISKGANKVGSPQINMNKTPGGTYLVRICQHAELAVSSSSSFSSADIPNSDKVDAVLSFEVKYRDNLSKLLREMKLLMPQLNCKGNIGNETSCAEIVLSTTKCPKVRYQLLRYSKKISDYICYFYDADGGPNATENIVKSIKAIDFEGKEPTSIKDREYIETVEGFVTILANYEE